MSTLLKKIQPSKGANSNYPLYKYHDKNIDAPKSQRSSQHALHSSYGWPIRLHSHMRVNMWECRVDFCYRCICSRGCQRMGKLLKFWSFRCVHSMSINASLAGWTAGCRIWSAGSQGTSPNTDMGGQKERDRFTHIRKMRKTHGSN